MGRNLQGRVALVTGGSRGIGRAIACSLAKQGADVAITFQSNEMAASETLDQIRAMGGRAKCYRVAVEDKGQCAALVEDVLSDFESLGILVNNAGLGVTNLPVAEVSVEEAEHLWRVHALGPLVLSQLAIPHLRAQARGDIIMISSVATKLLEPRIAPYTMAKASMEALALTLAKEEREHQIHVNVVAPGMTVTDLGQQAIDKRRPGTRLADLGSEFPFGRVCTPEEVAAVVSFLVSSENGYVNGAKIYVDGG